LDRSEAIFHPSKQIPLLALAMSQVAKVLMAFAPVLLAVSAVCASPTAGLSRTPKPVQSSQTASPNQIYQKVLPSVVTVLIGTGHGSGFIVSADGLIVTNAHVTDGAPRVVTVKFADGSTAPADVIGFSANRQDLSLIKVNVGRKLPAVTLANSRSIKVGDRVFALGTPLDENNANTFTQGDVIRIDRPTNRIFHTALINGGNSGGPLVDSQGRVVGVNTAGYADRPLNVYGADGTVIGQTRPESGQQVAVNVAQVSEFLGEFRRGKISATATHNEPSPATAASANQRKPLVLTVNGRKVVGTLIEGDNTLPDGSYADFYSFEGQAGQQVTIDLASGDFNSLLLLYSSAEGKLSEKPIAENDDAGPGSLNARIRKVLPADGTYYIVANAKVRGESGRYQISATLR
jgi:serine protease Do